MSSLSELRQMEIEYCRDHVDYYVRRYCVYEDKDADELIQPFEMWKEQADALESLSKHRLNVILKARQLGFSWLVISYASNIMLTKPGRTVIGISRREEEAAELVRRLEVEYANNALIFQKGKQPPGWDGATYEKFALKLIVHFPNQPDSVFMGLPCSPGSGRSLTADLVIFDEWAFHEYAEEIWNSAFPTINRPTGGKFIGLSTNIRGSLFEKVFTEENDFNKIFIPWYADPRRDEKWYEETKRNCIGDITEEYPATIEEALTAVGGAYFPEVKRDTHITKEPLQGRVTRYVAFDYGFDMFACGWFRIDQNNHAQLYKVFGQSNLTAGAAADIIKSITDEDEFIDGYLAPPDLWNRQTTTGKSTADVFAEHGIYLIKVNNSMFDGCVNMKEWLFVGESGKPRLQIMDDCADEVYRCLTKIQKDRNKPNVYAKQPHELTHMCLTGDTIIRTTKGDIPISELVGTTGYVYCKDEKGKITTHKYDPVVMTNPCADIYEVELEDGAIIKATANHKLWTSSGWKMVSELNESDEVLQFSLSFAIRLRTLCYRTFSALSTYCKRILFRK